MALSKIEVLTQIRRIGLVPVLRAESEEQAMALAAAIADGGVTVLEVTMTVPGAVRVIARLAKERPDILLGAGTVLDPETARVCMEEGAQFVVSPAFNPKTVALCQKLGIAVLPGALTPTEILSAWEAGADVVKVFPASAMGGGEVSEEPEGAAAADRDDSHRRGVAGARPRVSGGRSVCPGRRRRSGRHQGDRVRPGPDDHRQCEEVPGDCEGVSTQLGLGPKARPIVD